MSPRRMPPVPGTSAHFHPEFPAVPGNRLRSSLALGALLGLALTGCTQIQPPLTPPEAGGAPWRELVSKHVILRTDRGEDDAKEALVDLEQTYGALHDVGFPQLDVAGSRIVVVHFDRQRDFERLEPANMAGIFSPRLPNDLYPEPTMIVWGKLDAAARTTLQHELTHMFARSSLGQMPTWFNEGLAEYYETLAIEDGFAYIGRPLQTKRAWASSSWTTKRNGAFMTTYVPIGYVPEVEKLTAMDPGAFYVWSDKGRQPTIDEVRQQTGNYLGAFGLVHLILQDPKYQPRFDKLMDGIGKSMPFSEAWTTAFQDADAAALETDYRQHLLNKFETMVLRTPLTLPKVEPERVRAMDPAEVHLIWARLRPFEGAELPAAQADVEAAKRLAPQNPEVLFVSAELSLRLGKVSDAAADIEAALTARPDDERFLLAAAKISDARSASASPDSRAALQAKADKLTERLAKVASSGASLDYLASHAGAAGKPDEALAFAQRAVKADPTCAGCFATLGALFFARKDYVSAVRATQTALSLLPDGARDEDLEAQYKLHFEAAMKNQKRDKPEKAPDPGPTPAPAPTP